MKAPPAFASPFRFAPQNTRGTSALFECTNFFCGNKTEDMLQIKKD
jgi:hypothetical protein